MKQKQKVAFVEKEREGQKERGQKMCNKSKTIVMLIVNLAQVEEVSVITAILLSVAIFSLLVFYCLTKLTMYYPCQVKNETDVLVKINRHCWIKNTENSFQYIAMNMYRKRAAKVYYAFFTLIR